MSSKKSPAFQFYPDKLIAGTRHLKPRQFKAYMLVLCDMWLHNFTQCRILDDKIDICFAANIDARSFKTVWLEGVMNPKRPLLKKQGKWLKSRGLQKERVKQLKRRRKARNAAKAKAKQRFSTPQAGFGPRSPSPSLTPPTVKEKNIHLGPEFKRIVKYYCKLLKISEADYVITRDRAAILNQRWSELNIWADRKEKESGKRPDTLTAFCAGIQAWSRHSWFKDHGHTDLARHCCDTWEKLEGYINEARNKQMRVGTIPKGE